MLFCIIVLLLFSASALNLSVSTMDNVKQRACLYWGPERMSINKLCLDFDVAYSHFTENHRNEKRRSHRH